MIRRMQAGDLEQVAQLETCCFSESWSYKLLEAGLSCAYDIYYVFEHETNDVPALTSCNETYVDERKAKADSERAVYQKKAIIGYCCLRILAGEGEVQRIAVLPEYRRLGVGRKMMEAMLNISREHQVTAVSLEVRESNAAARSLYEAYGFAAEAVRKNYYHEPTENAVIMWNRNP